MMNNILKYDLVVIGAGSGKTFAAMAALLMDRWSRMCETCCNARKEGSRH